MCERNELTDLSDDELLARLEVMAASEKRLGAKIVMHLIEVESRELYLALGHDSLYRYAVVQLGFSEDVAYKRIKATRVATLRPEIVDHLETGDLSLSGVLVMAPIHPRSRER